MERERRKTGEGDQEWDHLDSWGKMKRVRSKRSLGKLVKRLWENANKRRSRDGKEWKEMSSDSGRASESPKEVKVVATANVLHEEPSLPENIIHPLLTNQEAVQRKRQQENEILR